MSDPLLDEVGKALRKGQPEVALQAARKLCETANDPRDAAIEVARTAAAVYRDLIVTPVHQFADGAEANLDGDSGVVVAKALRRLIRMTHEWEEKLWSVHTERLAREIRDWTRMRHLDAAANNITRLIALVDEDQRPRRATYIGNVLGTVVNAQKEAAKLTALMMRQPERFYLTAEQAKAADEARQNRINRMIGVNLENIEQEYKTVLTQTIVEIQNKLPESTKMSEPDETVLREVGDIFRSILRVPIYREEADLLLDATQILVDFVPREQSATSKLARVEGRVYNNLGFTAKKAVMLTFQDIGKNAFFTNLYKKWARDYTGTDTLGIIVELMGALRTPDFNDFFRHVKSDKHVSEGVRSQLSSALGSVAGEEAAESLLAELKKLLGKRHIQTAEIREAERLISSLGNIIKSPRTDFEERNRIHEFLREHIPEDLTKLACFAAMQAFTAKIDEQTGPQKHWAIRVLARALWLPDETTAHQKGEENPTSELGFREPIVNALEKLGPHDMHTLVRAVEPLTSRYGGGFMAAAELFERLKNPEALPLLDAMLTHTILHDDDAVLSYQQEYYWDAATQSRKPLTKEKILGPIVFAIGSIGGDKAQSILLRYKEGISNGRVPSPPAEVAGYLQRFLGDKMFAAAEEGESDPAARLDPAEVKALIKQATASYFFSGKQTRRAKKIEALTRLGIATPIDAIDPLFPLLSDKDPMVVSAAITCLAEYAMPKKNKTLRDLVINTCLDQLESKDPAVRQGAIKLLKEIGPGRKDVKDKVLAFAKHVERRETREALMQALKSDAGSETLKQLAAAAGGGDSSGRGAKDDSGGEPDAIGKLELKRQYMEARREWIAGGKKGDPPPKPPGMD